MLITRGIRFFFVIAFVAAIAFPLVNFYYVFPLFSDVSLQGAEEDATRIARHLSRMVFPEDKDMEGVDPRHVMEEAQESFNLWKIRAFTSDGEVIYSSDKIEEGASMEKEHIKIVSSLREPLSQMVQKKYSDDSGRLISHDVVEIYVPIIRDDEVNGIFEIYYDITTRHLRLREAVLKSSLLLLGCVFALFLAIVIFLVRADRVSQEELSDVKPLVRQSPYYLLLMIALSVFLAELGVMFIVSSFPEISITSLALWDAMLLVLLVSPVLYMFLLRPLLAHIHVLRATEDKLRNSVTEKEVLLKEIHHRVKNNLQVISSMLGLQARQLEDGSAQTALMESESRVHSMSVIHEMLYASDDFSRLSFSRFVNDLVSRLLRQYQGDGFRVDLRVEVPDISMDMDTIIPCGLILNELITNSFKHAYPDKREGELAVLLQENKVGDYVLMVRDDGVGMPGDVDFRQTRSLGLQIVRAMVEKLDGIFEVVSNNGTEFRITFPQPLRQSGGEKAGRDVS